MAFENGKAQQGQIHKFDWDDINVGNNQLDNSQNFFSKKHYEHERLDEVEFLQIKMEKTALNEGVEKGLFFDNKENVKANCTSQVDEQNIGTKSNEHCSASPVDVNKKAIDIKNEANCRSPVDENKKEQGRTTRHFQLSPNVISTLRVDAKKEQNKRPESCPKVDANLACEWSLKKTAVLTSKGVVSKSLPPPQAYLVKDIYQRKRVEAERRRAEEERKLREFHSRPAPDFKHYHELLEQRKPIHAITVAKTPQVLKNSREAEEKRRKRLEEWKQKNLQPKFEPRSPSVLREKPFIPEKKLMVVQTCPFKLHVEKRLQERKHYDEAKQKALEEKQKQDEEERKRLEKERIKELRKAASFKARPNPFKH